MYQDEQLEVKLIPPYFYKCFQLLYLKQTLRANCANIHHIYVFNIDKTIFRSLPY